MQEKLSQRCHFTATSNTRTVRNPISPIHSPLRAVFVMDSKITPNCLARDRWSTRQGRCASTLPAQR